MHSQRNLAEITAITVSRRKLPGSRFTQVRDYRQNFRGDIIIARVPELLLIYEISHHGRFKTRQLAIKKKIDFAQHANFNARTNLSDIFKKSRENQQDQLKKETFIFLSIPLTINCNIFNWIIRIERDKKRKSSDGLSSLRGEQI